MSCRSDVQQDRPHASSDLHYLSHTHTHTHTHTLYILYVCLYQVSLHVITHTHTHPCLPPALVVPTLFILWRGREGGVDCEVVCGGGRGCVCVCGGGVGGCVCECVCVCESVCGV